MNEKNLKQVMIQAIIFFIIGIILYTQFKIKELGTILLSIGYLEIVAGIGFFIFFRKNQIQNFQKKQGLILSLITLLISGALVSAGNYVGDLAEGKWIYSYNFDYHLGIFLSIYFSIALIGLGMIRWKLSGIIERIIYALLITIFAANLIMMAFN